MVDVYFDLPLLEDLRVSVGEWARKNFGHTLPKENRQIYGMLRCAAGMTEEIGELIEGGLGLTICPTDVDAKLDAVSDICIFALDFMFMAGLAVEDVLVRERSNRWERQYQLMLEAGQPATPVLHEGLSVLIGALMHHVLKKSQGIRNKEDHDQGIRTNMLHIWRLCYVMAHHLSKGDEDLNDVVAFTAKKVLARDWVENPDGAHEEK